MVFKVLLGRDGWAAVESCLLHTVKFGTRSPAGVIEHLRGAPLDCRRPDAGRPQAAENPHRS
jgi:hypothetical protein